MKDAINIRVLLDNQTYEKIREFSVLHDVSQSEIIRVLLNKTTLKIDTRDIKTIQHESKQGKANKNIVLAILNNKLLDKLKIMVLKNKASYSEIVRCLITNSDLDTFSYKTKSENLKKAQRTKK